MTADQRFQQMHSNTICMAANSQTVPQPVGSERGLVIRHMHAVQDKLTNTKVPLALVCHRQHLAQNQKTPHELEGAPLLETSELGSLATARMQLCSAC